MPNLEGLGLQNFRTFKKKEFFEFAPIENDYNLQQINVKIRVIFQMFYSTSCVVEFLITIILSRKMIL